MKSIWLLRVIKGYRIDEEEGYVEDKDNFVLERKEVDYDFVNGRQLPISTSKAIRILKEDEFDNWDCENFGTLDDAMNYIQSYYGLTA